ncbi:MAG: alpha-ribazole phosphatase [Methylococcales bacterium]
MDIYLIRHTQTNTLPGLCYGQSEVGLADSFAAECRCLAEKLPERKPDCVVFSSPLLRCTQLAETFSTNIKRDARLLELNFGDWEMRRFDDLDTDTVKHWAEHFVKVAPPNGESFSDLVMRAGDFWQDLLKADAEQVLVITHAGVIRAFLGHILELPLANAFQFKVEAGSVHKLQVLHSYTSIHYLNH